MESRQSLQLFHIAVAKLYNNIKYDHVHLISLSEIFIEIHLFLLFMLSPKTKLSFLSSFSQ